MKTYLLPTFAAGLLLGWLCAAAWYGSGERGHAGPQSHSRPDPEPRQPAAGGRIDAGSMLARDPASRRTLDPPLAARLQQALRGPAVALPQDIPASRPADQRVSRWLDQSGIPAELRARIAEAYARELSNGDADPLQAGSGFDQWVRQHLDDASAASWNALLAGHREDGVERRANRLLSGMQGALSLSPDQKDAIYPKLAEWARSELALPAAAGPAGLEAVREQWLASRYDELSGLLPADQHDALADWLTDFLPAYWLSEDRGQ